MNKNIRLFNEWAEIGKDVDMQKNHTDSVNHMIGILNKMNAFKKPFNFLDIGCGNGWVVRKILKNNNCLSGTGIDGSMKMIDNANLKGIGKFICENVENYNFQNNYNIIFSMETLYYFKNISNVIKKIYSILDNAGIIIIGIDHYEENKPSLNWSKDYGLDITTLSVDSWLNLFSNYKDIKHTFYGAKNDWNGTLIIYAKK